jgi:hypothetical protein
MYDLRFRSLGGSGLLRASSSPGRWRSIGPRPDLPQTVLDISRAFVEVLRFVSVSVQKISQEVRIAVRPSRWNDTLQRDGRSGRFGVLRAATRIVETIEYEEQDNRENGCNYPDYPCAARPIFIFFWGLLLIVRKIRDVITS